MNPEIPRFLLPVYRCFLPELRRFATACEQVEALRTAFREIRWKPTVFLLGFLRQIGGSVLSVDLISRPRVLEPGGTV